MEGGKPIITDTQKEFIKKSAALLGEDGDAIIQDIQTEAETEGRLPADIFKIIEGCCQDLSKRVASLEKSNKVVKERETERLTQVEAMREQVTRFNDARAKGDIASLMKVKLALDDILEKFMKNVDKDEEDGLAPDIVKTWKNQAYEVVKEAAQFLQHFEEGALASVPEDGLAPLKEAIGTANRPAEAATKEVQDPSKERLRDLARKLGAAKKEIMAMSRSLMVGQSASLATEAHRLANDVGEVIKSSRETIKAALRGLGLASDILEISGPTRAARPPPARPVLGSLNADWATGSRPAASAWPPLSTPATTTWPPPEPAPGPRMGGASSELTALMQGLMGAQANDSVWPTFSGKYAEYPRFQKKNGGPIGRRNMGT